MFVRRSIIVAAFTTLIAPVLAQEAVVGAHDAEAIFHNPPAASGRSGVVAFFTEVLKVEPTPIPTKIKTKVVSVTAEGDIVVASYVRELKDPKDPSKDYTTTWFDMWRIIGEKADEHWDPATR